MRYSLIKNIYINLWANKLRSGLALLGVAIGVAAVVALVSSGQMAAKHSLDKLRLMGTDLLSVNIYSRNSSSANIGFSHAEVKALEQIAGVRQVAPIANLHFKVTVNSEPIYVNTIGVTAAMFAIAKVKLHAGRLLFPIVDSSRPHCLVGDKVSGFIRASGVFPVLGSGLLLGDNYCQVVGVLQKWPSNFFIMTNLNRSVILLLDELELMVNKELLVQSLVVKLDPDYKMQVMQRRLLNIIKQWKPEVTVNIRNPEELVQQISSQKQNFTLLLGLIGGIALLVGGIGIMNVMLANIAERKVEIGLRMAIGASRADIWRMFLLEAIFLCMLGGFLGLVLGLCGAGVIAWLSHWEYVVFFSSVVLGFVVSGLIGVFFGFYPAYKASLLDPIIVLRGLD